MKSAFHHFWLACSTPIVTLDYFYLEGMKEGRKNE